MVKGLLIIKCKQVRPLHITIHIFYGVGLPEQEDNFTFHYHLVRRNKSVKDPPSWTYCNILETLPILPESTTHNIETSNRKQWLTNSLSFVPYILNENNTYSTYSSSHYLFAAYNQQDATFHNLFISVGRCTCFRRVFRPSSGTQNCTYRVRYLLDQYCFLLLAVQASSR